MLSLIVRFCTKYMSIGVVLIGIFSIFWPEVMKPFAPKIPTLLGIIMFGMGMSLTPGDFKNVFKQPKNVAIGTVLQFIIMPAAAFALIHLFALPPKSRSASSWSAAAPAARLRMSFPTSPKPTSLCLYP